MESQSSRLQPCGLTKFDGQFVHRLPGTTGQDADAFECRIVNQVRAEAKKSDRAAQAARFETDKAKYEEEGKQLNAIHFDQMLQIPLWQPAQDAVMAPNLDGYVYQFTRQVDYRNLSRK